jgi:hypothetical protein
MRRSFVVVLAFSLVVGTLVVVSADDDDDDDRDGGRFRTSLSGFNEVHFAAGPPATLRGAISSTGRGRFEAEYDGLNTISYRLSYRDLEGAVTQSHIHFGQRSTVGGIVVWLCETAASPAPPAVAAVTPDCPEPSGTVSGTITAAQVLAQTAQGIEAGAFDEVVRAIRAGAMYVNVHSSLFPPGEIRGHLGGDHD